MHMTVLSMKCDPKVVNWWDQLRWNSPFSFVFFFVGLPDPFAKIVVEGTGQQYTTDIYKASLDPKWNVHYDLYLSKGDGIMISVWNQKKIHKKQSSGFLGCVRIVASTIQRLKDTGCEYIFFDNIFSIFWVTFRIISNIFTENIALEVQQC